MKIKYNVPSFPAYEDKFGSQIELMISNFIDQYIERDFIKIDEIVFTETIWNDIYAYYDSENFNYIRQNNPKGFIHASKFITIRDKTILFYQVKYMGTSLGTQILLEQIVEHSIDLKIKSNYQTNFDYKFEEGLQTIFYKIVVGLISEVKGCEATRIIFNDQSVNYKSTEEFTYSFKRIIKSLHNKYQEIQDHTWFLYSAFDETIKLLSRSIKYGTDSTFKFEEFDIDAKLIIQLINGFCYDNVPLNNENITRIQTSFLSILEKCDINVNESGDGAIGFKIKFGPKKLFPELVDTHQRIVCFMDILGFSAIIDEYDNDESSVILRDINKALNIAVDTAFNLTLSNFDKDLKENFEYRMFSDCIVMSLPYIEFGVDFKQQFYFLAITIQAFQQSMLSFGFYLRGSISTGSYFSSPNMLFSGGLVNAYNNERPTKYPIISISDNIINKLNKKTEWDNSLVPMGKILIKHNYNTGEPKIFINPFQTIQNFSETLSYLNNTTKNIFKDIGLDYGENLFSNLVENLAITHNQSSFQTTIDRVISTILSKLIEKINGLKDKNANPNNTEDQIKPNASIMEKYVFLENLFVWLENGESDLFEYYDINSNE